MTIMWIFLRIVLILISGPFLVRVLAIACYECNQFPHESKSPCPATRTVNYGFLYDVSSLQGRNQREARRADDLLVSI